MRRRDLINGTGLPNRDTSVKVDPSVIKDMVNKEVKPDDSDSVFVGSERLEDGTVGLLIDRAEMAKRLRDKMLGETEKRLVKLANQSDKLFDEFSVKGLEPGQEDPVDELIRKKGTHDPDVIKIMDVKKRFAGFDLSANGLAPKGSDEVNKYYEAMELIRSGKVVLPTVEEYEAQKKALENGIVEDDTPLIPEEIKDLPTEINKERNVNEMANDNNAQNVISTQKKAFDPSKVVKAQPITPPAEVTVEESTVPPVEEPKVEVKPNVVKAKPLNLAKLEAESKIQQQKPVQETTPVEVPEVENVTINVPEEKADVFMTQLDKETKEKITQAKAIKINRVELKDIPTATGTISSLDEYKRVVPRKVSGEFKELPLPNSGYIITVSSASSLEMASVIQRGVDTTDWAAQYKFCYDHLITTSVGNMSYNDFVNSTSTIDVEGILGAIYQLSQSVTRIELNCGNPKCKKSYPVEYNSENLMDVEALDQRTVDQINKLIMYADNIDEAKAMQEAAPVNQKTVIFIDDLYITLKHTDGAMIIQQQPVAEELTGNYNFLIPLIITQIKSITKMIDGVPYKLDNPFVMAEELNTLPDESLREILAVEKSVGEEQYVPYSYALKGPFKCPHCNNVDDKIPVDSIAQLVFLKVQSLLEEVL